MQKRPIYIIAPTGSTEDAVKLLALRDAMEARGWFVMHTPLNADVASGSGREVIGELVRCDFSLRLVNWDSMRINQILCSIAQEIDMLVFDIDGNNTMNGVLK